MKYRYISTDELQRAMEAHKKWLDHDPDGKQLCLHYCDLSDKDLRDFDLSNCYLMNCDLSHSDLSGINIRGAFFSGSNLSRSRLVKCTLSCCDFTGADLSECDFSHSDLRGSDLNGCNLYGCRFKNCDLRCCLLRDSDLSKVDFSGCIGLISQADFLAENFEQTADGYIAYKTFGCEYAPPARWEISPGSVISEVVNFDRTQPWGCGINVSAHKESVFCTSRDVIWKVLIRWEWLPGVCVPFNSSGNIRCEKVELIEEVKL